jgi:Fe-S cluster biogenesis protein NfuA/nitrite reductase/ring-hydroxylating ferredoxin subunit
MATAAESSAAAGGGAAAVERVEALLEGLDALPDPAARETATGLVRALLELYGDGLRRIAGRVGDDALADLAADELVGHLLMLHDLHPVPLLERVRSALDAVRPYLESHGGDVELLAIEDGVARVRLDGSCDGCPSSAATLKLAIEDAIAKAAPEVERVEADGLAEPPAAAPAARREWTPAGTLADVADGEPALRDVAGATVLFARIGERVYAYRPACPGCGRLLGGTAADGRHLACAGCGRRYDLRLAGRCAGDPGVHLDPVPLLPDGDGGHKVALG